MREKDFIKDCNFYFRNIFTGIFVRVHIYLGDNIKANLYHLDEFSKAKMNYLKFEISNNY